MEAHNEADINLQPLENFILQQVDAPEGDLAIWEPCSEVGFWENLRPHRGRRTLWTKFAVGTCDPMRYPTLEQSVPEELHPIEETCRGAVHEELQPV
ncbi:hypothetical protein DUI87_07178 [Hirundo rustica rustica]|uniref:Uncharacterized protein n=1 Tax=Hirundo rustica rustica TaxID=333673 RepID=A0A3M0KP40_HIRRU|nr:hypothetical protein DUI87_07178 [Hirundo rustica rustica]